MTGIPLEIAKIKRRRVLPITLAVTLSGVAWTAMAIGKMAAKGKIAIDAVTVLNQYNSVLPMVAPLMVAVLIVRVAGAEQENDMLTRLVAAGASRTSLWINKLLLIAGFLVIIHTIGFAGAIGFGLGSGATFDAGLTAQCLVLALVTSVELAAPLLVIALRGNRQPVVIAIGLALTVAGALLSLAPVWLQMVLPSTQIYAANPTKAVFDAANYVSGYALNPEGAALIPLVALIAAAVVAASAIVHRMWKVEA